MSKLSAYRGRSRKKNPRASYCRRSTHTTTTKDHTTQRKQSIPALVISANQRKVQYTSTAKNVFVFVLQGLCWIANTEAI